MKNILILVLVGFCFFCGLLVVESGLFDSRPQAQPCILLQQTAESGSANAEPPVPSNEQLQSADFSTFGADNAPAKRITLGSIDPESGFKFELELTSKGAAINKATFSEFDDRDYKDPQPLVILSPVGTKVLSMANKEFVFVQEDLQLPLGKLHWQSFNVEKNYGDGSQSARFEAIIKDGVGGSVIKLVKTYKVFPGSYHLDCDLTIENLTAVEQKVRFNLAGPVGLGREGLRTDMRKAIAGFRDSQGRIVSTMLDARKLPKAKVAADRRLIKPGADFLWAAVVNKYFAAIVRPVPAEGKDFCDWVSDKTAQYYNPDGDSRGDSGDETIGVDFSTVPSKLAPAGQQGNTQQYSFQLYLGPKDKGLFDENELYHELGFVYTITFMPCFCCPTAIIYPMAFGILAMMKWMYSFIPNYGVVIIILVFLVRLLLHPLTKKSQVSMSGMSKLGPKAEEIKKKYANNKAEMNKHLMALYREQGISPVAGMLPMFVQMPIWIALYSAIYASIALRGAAFLPVWITDLSAPDALFRFPVVTLPLFGKLDSFNLLPLLMGVAFYLQQKLMPSQAAAAANPQAAQQQKMMMIMFPLLFPLMLYKAPSGLNLYIMSSVSAGVIEQYFIRKHIREREDQESKGLVAVTSKTGGKVKKKKPKPFFKI